MSLKQRIQAPTPAWFKRIIRISLTLAAVGTALLTADEYVKGFTLPNQAHELAQWFVVAGLVAAAASKTAKEDGGNA